MKEKSYFDQANDWESSNRLKQQESVKLAWLITKISVVITILLLISFICLLPLKESVPYVIRVDNTTGVPDIVTMFNTKEMAYDEIRDKYFLAQYVKSRETYDPHTIQKDYDLVNLFSNNESGSEYRSLFEGKDALDVVYGNSVRVTVKIISVVPSKKGIGTIRFIKTTKRLDSTDDKGTETKWVATVGYEYKETSSLFESSRLVNPFGFQALSYRVDPEMGIAQ